MTRQDFVEIAKVLREAQEEPSHYEGPAVAAARVRAVRDVADRLASYFAARNERFNRDRFIVACTPR